MNRALAASLALCTASLISCRALGAKDVAVTVRELFEDRQFVRRFNCLEDDFDFRCRELIARKAASEEIVRTHVGSDDARASFLALDLLDCMGFLGSLSTDIQVEYHLEFWTRTARGGGFDPHLDGEKERHVEALGKLGLTAIRRLNDLEGLSARQVSERFPAFNDQTHFLGTIRYFLAKLGH